MSSFNFRTLLLRQALASFGRVGVYIGAKGYGWRESLLSTSSLLMHRIPIPSRNIANSPYALLTSGSLLFPPSSAFLHIIITPRTSFDRSRHVHPGTTDAEALADTTDRAITQDDRDDLAHVEPMYPPKMSHEAVLNTSKNSTDSPATTPETETEFDWEQTDSEDEEQVAAARQAREEDKYADQQKTVIKRAKRLRKVYLACMRLSRPVRTLLIAIVGGSILAVPTIVVWTRFYGDRAATKVQDNIKVWSLWLTILWTSKQRRLSFIPDALPANNFATVLSFMCNSM